MLSINKLRKPNILITAQNNPIILEQIIEDVGPRALEVILAYSTKALDRYNVREGRIFGDPRGKARFRIIQLAGNVVAYKDLVKDKIDYMHITDLVESWNLLGYVEITRVDYILDQIKKTLTPFLGGALVGGLLAWLMKKLGK